MTSLMPGERRVVAIRRREVKGHEHIVAVKLDDDTMIAASEVIRQILDHVSHFVMIPPPGAPAYEAYMKTGYPLIVQTRACPDCGERVLFA